MKHKANRSPKRSIRQAYQELAAQIRAKPAVFTVWSILRLIVIAIAVRSAFQGLWESFFVCMLTLLLFMATAFVERQLNIKLPTALEVTLLVFIFCAEILGEIGCYYLKYPFWDTMLHTVNGFLFAAFGFCLIDLLNENKRIRFEMSPTFLAVVAFCFSMTIGVVWEFFEYAMDTFFLLDMQKDTIVTTFQSVKLDPTQSNTPIPVSDIVRTVIETQSGEPIVIQGYLDIGLHDTIKDLFVNFIGAVIFSVIGWLYIRHRGKNRIAAAFIPVVEHSLDSDEASS